MKEELIRKYNVAAPRYTSYPTVPYWDIGKPDVSHWTDSVIKTFNGTNNENGISLYIHLPFCESLCTYCGCNTRITVNHAVEEPYIKALLKEWKMYCALFSEKPVIREIHLGGGTPTFFKADNLGILIEGILKNSTLHAEYEFSFEGHPGNTEYSHLKTLFDLGFRRVSLGIQDFDPKVQDVIHRKQTFKQVKKVTEEARSLGYSSINYDLIYGLPLQTLPGIIDTIEKVNQLLPDRIAFYSYAHVPWLKPGQRKFTELDLPDGETKRNLYETGRAMLEGQGYVEIGMDHFSLREDSLYHASENKTLHRNFMGYTTSKAKLLIGLGVSSISDSWNAFAQNVKVVEEYESLIGKEDFPVSKSHFLTEEDLTIRKHILNIMCTGETEWLTDETFSFIEDGISRMNEMQAEGLIDIHANRLVVTETGKPFIRNICMALDARYWESRDRSRLFSKAV